MGPQCSGTLSTYCVATENEAAQRREVGKAGPQHSSTLSSHDVATYIQVLQRGQGGEVGPWRSGFLIQDVMPADMAVLRK